MLGPVLGSLAQETYRTTGESPERAIKMMRDLPIGRKAERTGTIQPGEEEAQRGPYQWL